MTDPAGDLIIVTGMTGAGRSTAAKALEDLGWFVIDNLPPQLLLDTVTLLSTTEQGVRLAVVVAAGATQPAVNMSTGEILDPADASSATYPKGNDD